MKYYHLTDLKNLHKIFQEGLKADILGNIFLFENKSITFNGVTNTVADCIACNQVFLDKYVIIQVDGKGIEKTLVNDNVAEFSSSLQWIAKQDIIDAKHLQVVGVYDTCYKSFI